MQLHYYQMIALKSLLLSKDLSFAQLNTEKLSSDQFTYHLKALIRLGLISKNPGNRYELTQSGKQLASGIDTETSRYEKQPKTGVCIIVEKVENGKKYVLVQERLKQPYYGYFGFIAGKCRYGEVILETGKRELMEEADLQGKVELKAILREHVYNKDGEILEDKIFHILHVVDPVGELKVSFDSGANQWLEVNKLVSVAPKFYDVEMLYKLATEEVKSFYQEISFTVDEF